jgi:hypothetical protein
MVLQDKATLVVRQGQKTTDAQKADNRVAYVKQFGFFIFLIN